MKTALKIFLLVSFIALGVNTNAQNQGTRRTPEDRAKMETDTVKVKAGLTEAQVSQYQAIALKYVNSMRGFRDMSPDSAMKKRTELMEKKNAEVKAILSDEQYVKYIKFTEDWNNRRSRGGNRGGGERNRPNQ